MYGFKCKTENSQWMIYFSTTVVLFVCVIWLAWRWQLRSKHDVIIKYIIDTSCVWRYLNPSLKLPSWSPNSFISLCEWYCLVFSFPLPVEGICSSSIQKWQMGPLLTFFSLSYVCLFFPSYGWFIGDSHATVCCYAVFFSQGSHMHKGGLGGQLGCQVKWGTRFKVKNTKLKKYLQFENYMMIMNL
jgi:hypothetical protein